MTDFKVKIGSKEAVLDVQVIVLPLLSQRVITNDTRKLINSSNGAYW